MTGVNGAQGAQGSFQSGTGESLKKILGKDDFLKLLITQLKYQDPMEPTDNREFIAQMAQFSSLEQMSNMSQGFQKLAVMQEASLLEASVGQAVNMIGRTVTAVVPVDGTGEVTSVTGVVTGMKMADGVPNVVINGRTIPSSFVEEVKMTASGKEG